MVRMDNATPDDESYNKAVAKVLRDRKESMGITFDALADASGLPRSTVSRMIYGARDIKVSALRQLAAVLELDAGDVLDAADAATRR